jgi:hypothetical protein
MKSGKIHYGKSSWHTIQQHISQVHIVPHPKTYNAYMGTRVCLTCKSRKIAYTRDESNRSKVRFPTPMQLYMAPYNAKAMGSTFWQMYT